MKKDGAEAEIKNFLNSEGISIMGLSAIRQVPRVPEDFFPETIVNTVGVDDHGTYSCNECLKVCPLNNG